MSHFSYGRYYSIVVLANRCAYTCRLSSVKIIYVEPLKFTFNEKLLYLMVSSPSTSSKTRSIMGQTRSMYHCSWSCFSKFFASYSPILKFTGYITMLTLFNTCITHNIYIVRKIQSKFEMLCIVKGLPGDFQTLLTKFTCRRLIFWANNSYICIV